MRIRRVFLPRIGSYLHEASVLIGVLGFLEKVVANEPIGFLYSVGIIFMSMCMFLVGYILETE